MFQLCLSKLGNTDEVKKSNSWVFSEMNLTSKKYVMLYIMIIEIHKQNKNQSNDERKMSNSGPT